MRRTGVVLVALLAVTASCTGGGHRSDQLTLVDLNLLHGVFCPKETTDCRAPDRVSLLLSQLEGPCPEIVTLQEIDARLLRLLRSGVKKVCAGRYRVVWHGEEGIDRELVLTSLPVRGKELVHLALKLRTAFWVRLDSPLGPVDVVVTHLASGDNPTCNAQLCPPPCDPTGDARTCQAVQVGQFLAEKRASDGIGIVAGDLNAPPGSPPLRALESRGLVDSHLAAGNGECHPSTGRDCTSGREDQALTDLRDPASNETERIDYILVSVPHGCDPQWDSGRDADGDGIPTGLFHPGPAKDGPGGLAWPSDHMAISLDLACA